MSSPTEAGPRRSGALASMQFPHRGTEAIVAALDQRGLLRSFFVALDSSTLRHGVRRLGPPGRRAAEWLGTWSFQPHGISRAVVPSVVAAAAHRPAGWAGRHDLRVALRDWRARSLDRVVARAIPQSGAGVLLAMPGAAERSLLAARAAGMVTVLPLAFEAWGTHEAMAQELKFATSPALRRELESERMDCHIELMDRELRLAGVVLVESARMRDRVVSRGVPADRVEIMGYGVDTERFRPEPGSPPSGSPLRVLMVARVGYTKGVHYAAEGMRLAGPAVAGLTVVGPDMAAPARLLRRRFPEVRFEGARPHAAMPGYYHAADVLLLPTLADSMARVVAEAMACGIPVVTTRESGYDGLCEDGQQLLFVPAKDPAAIAAALVRLAGDPALRERLARGGRALALDLTWERHRERVDRLLDGRLAAALAGDLSG